VEASVDLYCRINLQGNTLPGKGGQLSDQPNFDPDCDRPE
jgi:hypothetical protein